MMLSRLAFLSCSNLNCAINFDIHSYLRFKTDLEITRITPSGHSEGVIRVSSMP